jgi:sec-independent protein translocase protein TatA
MGALGPFHWLIIAVVVLLLFGNRLPSVMRSLGLGVVEFKKGLQGIQEEMNKSGAATDKDKIEADKQQQQPAANEPAAKS